MYDLDQLQSYINMIDRQSSFGVISNEAELSLIEGIEVAAWTTGNFTKNI